MTGAQGVFQDRGTSGWDWLIFSARTGVPPDWTGIPLLIGYIACGMPLTVSRRRTFLYSNIYVDKYIEMWMAARNK